MAIIKNIKLPNGETHSLVDANYVHTDNNYTTTEKNKLAGIASGAEVNQNAFSNVAIGASTISADSKTDTLTLVGGANITLTPDATNDKITILLDDTVDTGEVIATDVQAGNLIVNGTSRFLNTINGDVSGTATNVTGVVAIANGGTGATSAANARTNLGVPTMTSDTYPTLLPTNGSNNWIKIGTSNSSYGLLPSVAGNAGSGHNYLGTSTWYWKYAYIDEIYGVLKGNADTATSATKATQDGNGAVITNTYLKVAQKGAVGGIAELDANGLVPSSQLPSFVDDVLEYSSKSAFPTTGETGKIYVATDTNLTYRWSGSVYTEISPSLALGETSSTAYRGDRGATAYSHATDSSRLTTATASGLYKVASTAQGHIASLTAVTKADITGLGIPGTDTNTHRPIQMNGTEILGNNTTPLNLKAGTNVSLGNSSGAVTITATDTKYTAGDNMTLSSNTFYATKRWNAVTQGQKWSRIILVANTVGVEGNSGLLHVACTRGNTVCNSTFLINTSHSSYGQITELGANNYSKFKVRLVVNSNGDYYVEIYDTASSIASGTTQTWHCSFLSFQPATITAYTTFTDGTTIPSGYTAKGEMETVVGSSALAIRNITRSGTTFTATRQDGTTFTFTQQDNDHYAWSDITSKPTTISGYGITDAKIASGVITLGSNTITPLTASSTLDATKLSGTIPTGCYTDTKNTAGSTDTSSKIFLIGATSQAANPQTYSQDTAYVGTDGCLYSGGTKVLTAHQDISGKVSKTGDTMTGCLSITSANASWAEGIRINRGNGGYCSFVMGGAANSTSGTGDNVWWLGCNPSTYSHKWFVAHNGSTQTGTYFYVDSASQQSPHFRVGGDLAVGSKTTMSKTCTLRYNDSTSSIDFIFTT